MIGVVFRGTALGAFCAITTSLLNAWLGWDQLDPVTAWILVTAGYLVGATEGG